MPAGPGAEAAGTRARVVLHLPTALRDDRLAQRVVSTGYLGPASTGTASAGRIAAGALGIGPVKGGEKSEHVAE